MTKMTMVDLKLDNDGIRIHVHASMRNPGMLIHGHDSFMSVDIRTPDEQVCLYLSPEQARHIGEKLLAVTMTPPPVVDVLYEVNAWRDGLEENN